MADRKKIQEAVDQGWVLASILEGAEADARQSDSHYQEKLNLAGAIRKSDLDKAKAIYDKAIADANAQFDKVVTDEQSKVTAVKKAAANALASLNAHKQKAKDELGIGMDFLNPQQPVASGGRTRI